MELKEVVQVSNFFQIGIYSIVERKESLRSGQKGFEIPNAMGFRWLKHSISTSDFKSHPETKTKVIYLIIFFNLKFLTDFFISGKRASAQTAEPGLHLESKGGKDAGRELEDIFIYLKRSWIEVNKVNLWIIIVVFYLIK